MRARLPTAALVLAAASLGRVAPASALALPPFELAWAAVEAEASGPVPVPEPMTAILLGAGLTGLAVFGRKRA